VSLYRHACDRHALLAVQGLMRQVESSWAVVRANPSSRLGWPPSMERWCPRDLNGRLERPALFAEYVALRDAVIAEIACVIEGGLVAQGESELWSAGPDELNRALRILRDMRAVAREALGRNPGELDDVPVRLVVADEIFRCIMPEYRG